MRISAGQLKGRQVAFRRVFSGKEGVAELRPTSAKVREALFDILRNDIADSLFLDLYAGTGAVGFEALSRGASKVVFVEASQRLCRSITDGIERMGVTGDAEVCREKVLDFLRRSNRRGREFDIIFSDAPYSSADNAELISLIDGPGLLREGGCLVIEHASKTPLVPSLQASTLRRMKDYRYGDTMLSLFRKGSSR